MPRRNAGHGSMRSSRASHGGSSTSVALRARTASQAPTSSSPAPATSVTQDAGRLAVRREVPRWSATVRAPMPNTTTNSPRKKAQALRTPRCSESRMIAARGHRGVSAIATPSPITTPHTESSAPGGPRAGLLRAGEEDGFEPAVGAERPHEAADVVAHRVLAEVQLVRDLRRAASTLEQLEDFDLARREVGVGRRRRLVLQVDDLP